MGMDTVWNLGLFGNHLEVLTVVLLIIAGNGASWAFGGVPMGTGLPNARPNNGPMTSFAQTIGASSQPATPLDLS